MRCLNCGKELDDEFDKCLHCGKSIIEMQEKWGKKEKNVVVNKEEKLKELRKRKEEREQRQKEIEQKKKEIEQLENTADDLIIECEGNVFKAIKLFKEKFNVSNDKAKEYIMKSQKKFSVDETIEENTPPPIVVYEEKKEIENSTLANVPRCPTCNSTNIEKMGMVGKMISTELFGFASGSIGKTFKCNNCGFKW